MAAPNDMPSHELVNLGLASIINCHSLLLCSDLLCFGRHWASTPFTVPVACLGGGLRSLSLVIAVELACIFGSRRYVQLGLKRFAFAWLLM